MPLVNISLRQGTTAGYRRAIADGVHSAMMDVLDLPSDDRFAVVHEHAPENFIHNPTFLGIPRSDHSVFLQLVLNHRPTAQKQRLFEVIVQKLSADPGLQAEDIFIGIVEVTPDNWWAFGRPAGTSSIQSAAGAKPVR
jgi:4-oxalocrotonate tautomerase